MRGVGGEISGSAVEFGLRSGRCSTRRASGTRWRTSCAYEARSCIVSLTASKITPPGGGPSVKQLDFTPMDAFITHVLETFRMDAERATKVFPPAAMVVLSFCDRVANDVVSSIRSNLGRELTPDW